MRFAISKKTRLVISLVSVSVIVSAGTYFQPWKLITDTRVEEALPRLMDTTVSTEDTTSEKDNEKVVEKEEQLSGGKSATDSTEVIDSPEVLAEGKFITHEHPTTGYVKILKYSDGIRILRIENLKTSNGPKLEVWLTDAPVIEGLDGWRVFDDGKFFNLGALKGNIGSQNYSIPSEINLDDYSSLSIWCERFSVSFGAAALRTP
jgi:Electron transfer DM13